MTSDPSSDLAPSRRSAAYRLAVRRYLRQARRHPVLSLGGLVLPGIGMIFVRYLPPLAVAKVLQAMLSPGGVTNGRLFALVGLFAGSWLIGEVIWRVAINMLIAGECKGIADLYEEAMDELLAKDLAFFHDSFAGSLTKKAIAYARQYEDVFDTISFRVVSNVVPFFFVVPVLWSYSGWLVLVLLGGIALAGLAIIPLVRRRQKLVDVREEASAVVAGHVADTIANMDTVRVFAQEEAELETHRRNVADFAAKAKRSWDYQNRRVDVTTSPFFVLTNTIGLLVAALIGRRTELGFEAVFIAFTYFANATNVVWEFNDIYRGIESSMSEVAQFTLELLDDPTVVDVAEPIALAPTDASVEFSAVRFGHRRGSGEPLFDGFDLRIAPGEKVGLVGRSGGGKSTLTHLLLRLMDIDAGEIRIGGQDIAQLRQADLRSLIAYVPQDPVMFHRSLRDNLAFGRPDASDADIRAAAAAAHAAEFIEALPDGYDTLVGERGVKLSGGQRQRVAIARALLRQAPILVLDEATSSLDSESEALIQPALLTLMEERTAIVIAHRLSTVQRMDRLIVLDRGRVIEHGPHAELIAAGGTYASLWSHQSGGFLVDDEDDVETDAETHAASSSIRVVA